MEQMPLIPYEYNMKDKKLENQLVLQNNTFTNIISKAICFVNNCPGIPYLL